MTDDELYINRCLQLAKSGAGFVSPNPMVGAVLVHNDMIIGEGYHRQYGQAHAEVNCINSVAEANRHLIPQSTMYVSLEPCAHYGKTPPCSDFIIQHKIKKVVIACRDAFAKVDGLGIQKLKDAAVEVVTGILEKEALELNKRFFCFHKNKRPYIFLKWAQSADGFIAKENYEAVAISNEYTNTWVHKMRAKEMAIMVGTNTAFYDKPSLTARKWPGKNPVRIFIDRQLKLDSTAVLFNNDAAVIVVNEQEEKQEGYIHYFKINKNSSLLQQLLQLLFEKNITSLMVEGGSLLLQSFVEEGWWDEAYIITNPSLHLYKGIRAIELPVAACMNSFHISTDIVNHYKNSMTAALKK